jgi:dynein heavy chain, axonemal
MGIIVDLFPKVEIPNINYGNLQKAIEDQLEVKNYQKPKKFLIKIIQLMETIMVRHGVMVVGLTGTGKTTVIDTLAKAMEQLCK